MIRKKDIVIDTSKVSKEFLEGEEEKMCQLMKEYLDESVESILVYRTEDDKYGVIANCRLGSVIFSISEAVKRTLIVGGQT